MRQFSCNDLLNPLDPLEAENQSLLSTSMNREGENDKIVSDEISGRRVDDGGGSRLRFEIIIREPCLSNHMVIYVARGWRICLFLRQERAISGVSEERTSTRPAYEST